MKRLLMKIPMVNKRQEVPTSRVLIDLESGQSLATIQYTIMKEEYDRVEKILEEKLGEQIEKLTELIIEAKQVKLHLAAISEEDISEEDVEVE